MNATRRDTHLRQVVELDTPFFDVIREGGVIGHVWFSPKRKGRSHGGECWRADHPASGRTGTFTTRTDAQEWVGNQW